MGPPSFVAHYRITGKLGEGGMGVVLRAIDTKLNREVAIKVIPDAFAQNRDRLARFTREAQVLASLNHPNIAAIYGVEERALIMELVEGPTLAERIEQGPMQLEEVLPLVRQIAEALEYAHDRGVVHRDLKPANIKITREGGAKVLDFGLAKALTLEPIPGDAAASPTLTMQETLAGTLIGTAAYMPPEQARGQAVDRRADIWAFGVVLYEMLTGRRLFTGATVTDTLAAVLKGEIDLGAVPAQVRPVLERCLRRDPRQRWHCIGDACMALEDERIHTAVPAQRRATPWIAASVLLATIAAATSWLAWRATRPVEHSLTRLNVNIGTEAMTGFSTSVAISPDGRRFVFPARGFDGKQQLATRRLDQAEVLLLPGTENGFDPFFSPDGQSIGFFDGDQLKTMLVQGGTPQALCPAHLPRGASWGADGNIVAALAQLVPLSLVPAAGGSPQPLTKLNNEELTHRWPQVLPGGRGVLFTSASTNVGMENADIEVLPSKTGRAKVLVHGGYYGRYLPSGHLLFAHQGTLYGVSFDVDRLELRGTPVPLADDLAADSTTGGGQFDFSTLPSGPGTFMYLAGKGPVQGWKVAWLDSTGKMDPAIAAPGLYVTLRLSPDGRKLAFYNGADIYVRDLERDTSTRLTFTGNGRTPIWTPDGKHIVFTSISGGTGLYWIRSNGSGEPQRLLNSPSRVFASSFSPDGRTLAYYEVNPETGGEIRTLPLDLTDPERPKPGKPELLLATPGLKGGSIPRISPDGRWMAYRSVESGRSEVYVRAFPAGGGGKWPISNGGGSYPIWSNNRRELFYETEDNRIMVAEYTVDGDAFVPGKPRVWSEKQIAYIGAQNLDLLPGGKRFVVLTMPEAAANAKGPLVHFTMFENFFDELRRRIPAAGK